MIKPIKIALFYAFISLFILGVFNRELAILGLDIRIFAGSLGVTLLAWSAFELMHEKRAKGAKAQNKLADIDWLIVAFLLFSILSSVSWIWNGLEMNVEAFAVVAFASAYHLLVYIVAHLNRHLFQWRYISMIILASGLILGVSIVISYLGIDLRQIGSAYPGGYVDKLASSLIGEIRYGGYAQDPNYASLFMVVTGAVAVHCFARSKKWLYLTILPLAVFCLLLSASKTILAMLPIALVIILIKNRKATTWLRYLLLSGVIVGSLIAAFANVRIGDVQTLNTRFSLWHAAVDNSPASPLIGNGLTAARSAAAETKWYVQPHSSTIQIAVDMGIIGLTLIFLILRRNLFSTHKLTIFITLIFLAHFALHETIYQAYFIFILGLLPLFLASSDNIRRNKKADVYVVNTLSNGGAERVVQNMANNSSADKTIILTLFQASVPAYPLKESVEVINLGGNGKKWQIPILADRLSRELDIINNNYEISLATTHLPMAHLVTRLTKHSHKFLYVIHGMYGVSATGFSGFITKIIYRNQAIVSVSKGLAKGDLKDKFHIRTSKMKTIYNAIDFQHIDKMLSDEVEKKKQILFVGRFAPPKNPLAAIQSFQASGLKERGYKLLMLGDGEMRLELEEYITAHSLGSSVSLQGFVDNPFSHMQESAMLLIASQYEAFTMVACEALYCGCPVVSFDINYGIDELLTGGLAEYIAKPGNPEDMGRVMRLAVKDYPSNLRQRAVDMVSPDVIMDQYYQIYKEWNK